MGTSRGGGYSAGGGLLGAPQATLGGLCPVVGGLRPAIQGHQQQGRLGAVQLQGGSKYVGFTNGACAGPTPFPTGNGVGPKPTPFFYAFSLVERIQTVQKIARVSEQRVGPRSALVFQYLSETRNYRCGPLLSTADRQLSRDFSVTACSEGSASDIFGSACLPRIAHRAI